MSALTLDFFPPSPAPPSRKRGLFDHLDPERPIYAVKAARIIAELPDLSRVERALTQVHQRDVRVITTLALIGIGMRIAQLPTIEMRRDLLACLPEGLRAQCEPHVRRFYQTKPWLRDRARGN